MAQGFVIVYAHVSQLQLESAVHHHPANGGHFQRPFGAQMPSVLLGFLSRFLP